MRKHALRSLTRRFAWLPSAALTFAASAATFVVSPNALAALQAAVPAASAAGPSASAGWVHAYAAFGEPKYGPGFSHFEYANPQAPKGGTLYLKNPDRRTSFSKFNYFTVKGNAPAGIDIFMLETLATASADEPQTMYGLLAESLRVAPDKSSITFRLNPKARFYDGSPVLAADVLHSFDVLRSKFVLPAYQTLLAGVERAVVLDERTIRFDLKDKNTDVLFTLGAGLPVFSRAWGREPDGKNKRFDEIVTEYPITTGPYTIGAVDSGRRIEFVRNPNYWARDLPVRRGMFNFDRVVYRYYLDDTVSTEAFKAGEFDIVRVYGARQWSRQFKGPKWDDGRIKKALLPTGFGQHQQAYDLNLRRPIWQDARVREAVSLAYDFDTGNNRFRMFTRASSNFNNSEFAAEGSPSAAELKLLEPFRKELPAEVFGPAFVAPGTGGEASRLRANLLRARALLEAAGWKLGADGKLRNAKGEEFVFEYLSPEAGARVATWESNLKKLGITMKLRLVDFALYRRRLEEYDFDMVAIVEGRFTLPQASDFAQLYGSKSADEKGNSNFRGVKSPAVDALIEAMTAATTIDELRTASRALDRVIMWNHWQVPDLYFAVLPTSWWDKFGMPATRPLYYSIDSPLDSVAQGPWPLMTWWMRDAAKR
jgi:microcin C transport system substrate-binding protein